MALTNDKLNTKLSIVASCLRVDIKLENRFDTFRRRRRQWWRRSNHEMKGMIQRSRTTHLLTPHLPPLRPRVSLNPERPVSALSHQLSKSTKPGYVDNKSNKDSKSSTMQLRICLSRILWNCTKEPTIQWIIASVVYLLCLLRNQQTSGLIYVPRDTNGWSFYR